MSATQLDALQTREIEAPMERGFAAASNALIDAGYLIAVSDAGEIMPPKSTWFEPKLRDGLLIHEI